MISIAGVMVPRAAIARLAQQMQRSDPLIANQLGHAIDANLPELLLHARDADRVLAALETDPIEELETLQEQLRLRPRDRERMGALYVLSLPPTKGPSPVTTEATVSA